MKHYLTTFIVTALMAVAVGFLPAESFRVAAYQNLSWFFMLVTVLTLVFALYNAESSLKIVDSLRENCKAVVVAGLIVVVGFLVSPPEPRILADETNLLGVSMEMHETTRCVLPVEALFFYHGMRTRVSEKTEMRPPAFPFILSIIHNLTGYRPGNAFVLNALCAWLSLMLLFLMIDRREGGLWGYVAMLAMAAYPVFVQYFTSAGFEVFNLTLMMLTFFLLDQFLESRNLWVSVAVIASLVLLAHSRYESILAVLCVAPVLLRFLPIDSTDDWREKLVFAFPLMLLPAFWLRSITWDPIRFQVENIGQAFSFSNFLPNLKGFVLFFLSGRSQKFAGPVLTMLAFVGLFLLIEKLKNKKLTREHRWLTSSIAACAILHLFARLFYSNGNLIEPYTSRLAIIFLPLFAGLAITGLRRIECFKSPVNIAPAISILMLTLMVASWPVAAANNGVRSLTLFREFKWAQNILQENKVGEEAILICDRPNMFVPYRYSAITFETAEIMAEKLEKMLKIKSYGRLVVIQHIRYRDRSPEENLPANLEKFSRRTLFESQLSTVHYLRITELKLP
jgi:hypothetical protein